MGVRLCPVARRKEPPGYAGAAQVEGGNPMEGVTVPPKTAHANGRFGPWFPRSAALRIGGLVAIAGRIIGPGEIGHDGGPRLRVILQVETEAVRFVGVDARLVLDGKRPLGNVGALAQIDLELVALPRYPDQRHRAKLGHVVLRRIGHLNAKAPISRFRIRPAALAAVALPKYSCVDCSRPPVRRRTRIRVASAAEHSLRRARI